MSESGENRSESIIRVAQQMVNASQRHCMIEGVPCTIDSDGSIQPMGSLHAIMKAQAEGPLRRQGISHHNELDSFIAHINRMKELSTTIWANVDKCLFTAIYNYDPEGAEPGAAGWMDHRAEYMCPRSPEWQAWVDNADISMTQDQFAQWIDEHMEDLIEADGCPKPIEMMEMARNLQIHTKGTFSRKMDPTTGQHALVCKEEHTKESTSIPRSFMTAIRVFDGGEQYRVEMKLQFRIRDGCSWFSYTVHRAEELKRDAFNAMRKQIADETERPVFAGRHD